MCAGIILRVTLNMMSSHPNISPVEPGTLPPMSEAPPRPGLRERKKEKTRLLIAETARALFRERGFDRVTVAEIADRAEVSEGTVFNYFPTKEDLFYSGMELFEQRLVAAVAARPRGETALAAFSRVVIEGTARLAEPGVAAMIADGARLVEASPALRAREREVIARATELLAQELAAETRAKAGDVTPLAAASALMGAQRALVANVHARVEAGEEGAALAAAARRQARRAFALLESGLSQYAPR